MAEWTDAPDLRDLATRVIARREDVSHVEPDSVLFLWENETSPGNRMKTLGRCYSLADHPIGHLTPHRFCIVFYRQNMDHQNDRQRAVLMWHELRHIPLSGDKLRQHDAQDFAQVLRTAGIDWADESMGSDIPDILAAEEVEEDG